MASNADLANELTKLKKEYLVDIILTGKIPSGVIVTSELRCFIECSNKSKSAESVVRNAAKNVVNLKSAWS